MYSDKSTILLKNVDIEREDANEAEQKSVLKKIVSWFSFGKPGTTQDLEMEIQELLVEGEEQGLISSLEEKMINSIFDFRDTQAAEIMTPGAEIISFEISSTVSSLVHAVREHGFTRLPLYRENPDRVVGFIHVKDLLTIALSSESLSYEDFLHPIHFISESKAIVDLLREFQKNKTHMAMVTDEFGAIRGLITMEDILEEIVGEIDDEYDDDEQDIEELASGGVLARARIDIEEVEERFGVELPEGSYESLGGLLIHYLGRLGVVGDVVEVAGLRFEIKNATNRNIRLVAITRIAGNLGEDVA